MAILKLWQVKHNQNPILKWSTPRTICKKKSKGLSLTLQLPVDTETKPRELGWLTEPKNASCPSALRPFGASALRFDHVAHPRHLPGPETAGPRARAATPPAPSGCGRAPSWAERMGRSEQLIAHGYNLFTHSFSKYACVYLFITFYSFIMMLLTSYLFVTFYFYIPLLFMSR